ncbi:MAG: HNH endonuclease [Methylococcaceae bacterium]|jgi:hypothetical protein
MPKYKELPSQEFLQECFTYDPDTGILTWKVRPRHHFTTEHSFKVFNTKFSNKKAGGIAGRGYINVLVKNYRFRAHRIIWKLVTGNEPIDEIDHIDTNMINNRFNNLREASHQENACNAPLSRRNKSGIKGCSFDKKSGLYQVDIQVNKVKHYLGRYQTAEEAHSVYCAAAIRLHKSYANFG